MKPTGVIFAVLDCDLDAVEAFNRWYDLEHVPPNVALPGVMLGRRYVATPSLHDLRRVDPTSGFANQRGTFLTIYTLCEDPAATVATMAAVRETLYATGRMSFPAEKKTVRDGDTMTLVSALGAPALLLPPDEVAFVGHTGLLVVQRRAADPVARWYAETWAPTLVALPGVHGVMTLRSVRSEETYTDLVLFEGNAVERTQAIRAAAPHHDGAAILADAPFLLIQPLVYPWVEDLQRSSLPATIA